VNPENVMSASLRSIAGLGLAVAALVACGKKDEGAAVDTTLTPPATTTPATPAAPAAPTLGAITLGSALGPDKRVAAPKETFGVRDTIYASVATDGSGTAQKLKAVWTMGAESVRTDSLMLDLSGPTVSEFHISRPRAWPAGTYRLTVTLNDGAAQTKDFVVK
jgi:hypothetical protein